jgi:hypothetical protein
MALCSLSCTVNLGDERGSRNFVSDISAALQATEKGLWCKEKDCFREPWKIDGQVFLPLPMLLSVVPVRVLIVASFQAI